MQALSQSSNIENMKKMTILLRSTIENVIKKLFQKDVHVINQRSDDQKI